MYGTTKQYAEWIADALHADLLEHGVADGETLKKYDCVVYGGGLYAGGILGIDLLRKFPCRRPVVFTVGLADPAETDYGKILRKNLTGALKDSVKVFHFRGGMDYGKLSMLHRAGMMAMKWITIAKPESKRTADDKELLKTYGGAVDFTNRESIAPLVEYVKQQEQA
jgi:hypothetical protein